MPIDATDASFEEDVLAASDTVPVVIDLWAPWCGPCRTLGPIIEKVVDETAGAVRLVKVNIDENPRVAAAFQVQSIPAVFAIKDRAVVDSFIGAVGEPAVREFVAGLTAPTPSEADRLVAAGDEASLRRALELEPDHPGAGLALADLLVERGDDDGALSVLEKLPDTPERRHLAALARLHAEGGDGPPGDLEQRMQELLERVRTDDDARLAYLDLLEAMDPDDPRRAQYRRALSSKLF